MMTLLGYVTGNLRDCEQDRKSLDAWAERIVRIGYHVRDLLIAQGAQVDNFIRDYSSPTYLIRDYPRRNEML